MAKSPVTKGEAPRAATVAIKPINFQVLQFTITGTAPLMQARFSKKAEMMEKMEAGSTDKSKKTRKPRDFEADFKAAMHVSTEGWVGHPASAFRNACIDVCRMVGFKMVHAKMSIFIIADGLDALDGQPLVRMDAGAPERSEMATRNANGSTDVRARPLWRKWSIKLKVEYDADQFTASDVANLLERAGRQVGVGEGRPFSKMSNGLGFGTFTIKDRKAA